MKKGMLTAACAACLMLLCACTALLERSYSVVEPYADRYWDSSAEDTLRVDNYQDLVNSLLMLVEQRAEEAVIRCSDEVSSNQDALTARNEVLRETASGAYLLENIRFSYESGANYGTATFLMTYRKDVEDPDNLMTLSDTQSLVDLLRLATREEHEKLTARFTYDTPRDAVTAAIESYWQELCREEMGDALLAVSGPETPAEEPLDGEPVPEDGELPPEEEEEGDEESPEEVPPGEEEPGEEAEPVSEIVYPPCPWEIHFYPDQETVEIVEIILK